MDYTPNVVSKRCFFFIFKHSWAPKRSWKISHGGPGKVLDFFPVKEWEPCVQVLAFFLQVSLKVMMQAYDYGLTQLMHDSLHWLDVTEHVKYKVIILTHRCLIGTAPRYLAADCVRVSEMAQRRHLRSATGHQLVVPSELVSFGRFLYSVRDCGTLCLDCCVTLATAILV